MALPMLVGGGAECGPSNPLQGLSKRFDQDRGLQQDHFGASRTGSSREAFRTQQPTNAAPDQDAARFFSASGYTPQLLTPGSAFDLSEMRGALPVNPMSQVQQGNNVHVPAAWASDFLQSQPIHSQIPSLQHIAVSQNPSTSTQADAHAYPSPLTATSPQAGLQWNSGLSNFRMNSLSAFVPQMSMQPQHMHAQPAIGTNQISWDREFSVHESLLTSATNSIAQEVQQQQEAKPRAAGEPDELARTAGLLLENIKHEQNPKFKQSQFLGLMKQLRDGEVVVDGNKMVESDGHYSSQIDVKGKGRAADNGPLLTESILGGSQVLSSANQNTRMQEEQKSRQEDPNDAYFRQDNEDYIRYWNESKTQRHGFELPQSSDSGSWDKLQADWDAFEATTTGIKAVDNYQFQHSNPYLLGDSSRTRTHMLHSYERQSVLENVLELEATVQRDMTNATAWYELGVKQQENEREHKALQALQRAVELDSSYLPAWLALAISYTNDNNRQGTYDAIYEWVSRNEKYRDAITQFRATHTSGNSMFERYQELIQCLITMARSYVTGDVDADIQIALAVLLNTNEEYEKAQDCFKTALEVRPDDWLLYNRVGATMANSGRAEEALNYYYRALELNPGYIRARFNLGISCINLRRFEEAAQHILDALVLQESDGVRDDAGLKEGRGVVSTALWDSLRTTCLHMQRADLATYCDLRDLEGFRNHFP